MLGRGDHGFDAQRAFFAALAQDPQLAGASSIAEPWDLGPGGYRLGGFPPGWLEWNDRFRDTMRGFWLQQAAPGDFAHRFCASSRRVRGTTAARRPASVNFITAHDGFTLRDLVSYEHKHNQANGEHNRDGHGTNHSHNCGVEGETDDPAVLAARAACSARCSPRCCSSQGTPMLLAGDEFGHTQRGNNNAYCQDNETTWLDWAAADDALIDYTARLVALRRRLLPLGGHWYHGGVDAATGRQDLGWLRSDGARFGSDDWKHGAPRIMGASIGLPGRASQPLLLLFNAEARDCRFALPPGRWQREIDSAPGAEGGWTSDVDEADSEPATYPLQAHSVALLSAVEASAGS